MGLNCADGEVQRKAMEKADHYIATLDEPCRTKVNKTRINTNPPTQASVVKTDTQSCTAQHPSIILFPFCLSESQHTENSENNKHHVLLSTMLHYDIQYNTMHIWIFLFVLQTLQHDSPGEWVIRLSLSLQKWFSSIIYYQKIYET